MLNKSLMHSNINAAIITIVICLVSDLSIMKSLQTGVIVFLIATGIAFISQNLFK